MPRDLARGICRRIGQGFTLAKVLLWARFGESKECVKDESLQKLIAITKGKGIEITKGKDSSLHKLIKITKGKGSCGRMWPLARRRISSTFCSAGLPFSDLCIIVNCLLRKFVE